jgi:hypothetical protein
VHEDAEAGAEPQHEAGILGDIGLVEGEIDGDLQALARGVPVRGGYSVAAPGREGLSGWTSAYRSAKRTRKSRAGEGRRGFAVAFDHGRSHPGGAGSG